MSANVGTPERFRSGTLDVSPSPEPTINSTTRIKFTWVYVVVLCSATGLALVALQGRGNLGKAFDLARRQMGETPSPMARAWLTIAMRLHGVKPEELKGDPQSDLMITGIEALAAPEGNYRCMQTAGVTT